jgi:hypothetical protein
MKPRFGKRQMIIAFNFFDGRALLVGTARCAVRAGLRRNPNGQDVGVTTFGSIA